MSPRIYTPNGKMLVRQVGFLCGYSERSESHESGLNLHDSSAPLNGVPQEGISLIQGRHEHNDYR
jgi:hypothetical protein